MPFSEKLRQDWAPILFFGIVIIIKTYYLIIYPNSNEDLWGLLGDIGHIEGYGRGAAFYLTDGLTSILYYAIALAFDTLVFFSFIIRVKARERPKGFRENVFPLITVFVPMIGFTLLIIPQVRQFVPGYSATTLNLLREISPIFPDRGAEVSEYGTRVPGIPGFHRFPLAVLAQSAVKGTVVFNAFPGPSYERFPKRRQGQPEQPPGISHRVLA